MSDFEVGTVMELRGGTVIECVEVYDDHGIRTGKWLERASVDANTQDQTLR